MKTGDIVIVLQDLEWFYDSCPKGTRLRLVDCRTTSAGLRWSGQTKNGHVHRNIPPEYLEVIA